MSLLRSTIVAMASSGLTRRGTVSGPRTAAKGAAAAGAAPGCLTGGPAGAHDPGVTRARGIGSIGGTAGARRAGPALLLLAVLALLFVAPARAADVKWDMPTPYVDGNFRTQ